jgi:hypothetical protein
MLSLERDKPVQPHQQDHHGAMLRVRTLDIFLFPLLSGIMGTAPTSDQAALMYDRALERHSYAAASIHSRPKSRNCALRTFDLLALLVTHIPCNLHRIAHKRITACMMYRTFHHRFVLDHVYPKACALREGAELVVDRLHLDRVERYERRLACALVAHVLMGAHSAEGEKVGEEDKRNLDAVNGGSLLVYDDGVDVTAEDDRDGALVLALRRLAQVDQPATHA